ncbi:MAG: SatD family protein, partial [Bacteroidota bacterium]
MNRHILMADVIHSGEEPSNELMENFKSVVEKINSDFRSQLLSPFTITLGDEFQGIVSCVSSGVKVLIAFEEAILAKDRPFQLRYVFHEGEVDTAINPDRAHEMLGPGLTYARRALNDLKGAASRFNISLVDKEQSMRLNQLFVLYRHFV